MKEDGELVADPSHGAHAVIWSRADGRTGFWFDWCDGNVYTANPDRMTLAKVLQIARLLGARVLGDDGIEYTTPGQELPIWELR